MFFGPLFEPHYNSRLDRFGPFEYLTVYYSDPALKNKVNVTEGFDFGGGMS